MAGSLRTVRRRSWAIVLTAIIVSGAAIAFSLLKEDQYSATATILFRESTLDEQLFGGGETNRGDPFRTAATNLELVSLDVVAERTAEDMGGLTGDDVDSIVDVSERGQSDLVSITATDPDPERSAVIANTFATNFIAFRRRADQREVRDTETTVRHRLEALQRTPVTEPEEKVLSSQLEDLAALSSLQTGNVELAERAEVPDDPSSPGIAWSGAVGAVVGLLLGIGLALLFNRLDRRIRDTEEVEATFGRPVLARIPEGTFPSKGPGPDRLLGGAQGLFRSMAANLRYFALDGDLRSLVIASADRGDGRTTIALNLAAAVATMGKKTVLVEADLRHPSLAARLGLEQAAGLSEVLAGRSPWEESILHVPSGDGAGGQGFDLLPAGHSPPNPADLLAAASMTTLLRSLGTTYDAVLIDTSAASFVTDIVPLLSDADGVIVVARLGHTSRDGIERLHHLLGGIHARVIGLVINSVSRRVTPGDGDEAEAVQQTTASRLVRR